MECFFLALRKCCPCFGKPPNDSSEIRLVKFQPLGSDWAVNIPILSPPITASTPEPGRAAGWASASMEPVPSVNNVAAADDDTDSSAGSLPGLGDLHMCNGPSV